MNEILTIIFTIITIFFTRKNIQYGIAGFMLIAIFPNIQGREIFGITGLNSMNFIFLAIFIKYFLPRIAGKIKENYDPKTFITQLIIILFYLHIIFIIRHISDFYISSPKGIFTAFFTFFIRPLQYYIVLYILFKTIRSIKDIEKYFFIVFLATLIGVVVLFFQYTFMDFSRREMWSNEFAGHKNAFGVRVAFFAIISIIFYFYSNKKSIKLLSLSGLILGGGVLIFSLSRTAWVSFLAGLIFLLYKANLKRMILLIPVAFLILSATPLSDTIFERIEQRGTQGDEFNRLTAGRADKKWQPQIDAIIDNPIFGGGSIGLLGHSGYLSTWNQLGLLGLIISFVIFYKMYRQMDIIRENSPPEKSFEFALPLTGQVLIFMVPFINLTGSLTFIKNTTMPTLFILFFFFIASIKLNYIYKLEYLTKQYKTE